MKRTLLIAALALPCAACTSYDCADFRLFEHSFGEQCGPAGSQGNLYFEDGMVMLIIGADFEDFLTEESSIILDYVPTVVLGFRSIHLEAGTTVTDDQLVVHCGRTTEQFGFYQVYPGGSATVEVIETSNRAQTGGQSWVFGWDVACSAEADMDAQGEDIIELYVSGTGWDFDLYGVPEDWPEFE